MRPGQIVFTYFHFAADEELTRAVHGSRASPPSPTRRSGTRKGTLPLLTPMSEVAGRMSIQEGAKYLERPFEGRGILLGGVPGVLPANVVDPRRRRRRRERRQGRRRPRGERLHPRHQPRPAALPRRRDAAERHDALQRPAQHPRHASSGPTCVIGAVLIPGAQGAAPGPPRGPEADDAAGGHHRRGHRPGRLRRDDAGRRRTPSRRTSSTTSSTTA